MKIAAFIKSTTLHKNHGGLETQNKVLCEGLVKKGHQVTVFSPKRDLDVSGAEESGVKYVFIDAQYGRKIISGFKKDSWEKMSLKVFEKVKKILLKLICMIIFTIHKITQCINFR